MDFKVRYNLFKIMIIFLWGEVLGNFKKASIKYLCKKDYKSDYFKQRDIRLIPIASKILSMRLLIRLNGKI